MACTRARVSSLPRLCLMMPKFLHLAQEEAESEESVRWLSYILDNDEAESGK